MTLHCFGQYGKNPSAPSLHLSYLFGQPMQGNGFLPQIYQPGSYKLAFKLATYNDTTSSIEIDNVRLKLYRVHYDLYPDNKIDLLDFAILANEWSIEKMPEDLAPDEGDGIINLSDFAVLASSWGQNPSQDMQRLKDVLGNWLVSYRNNTPG